MEKDTEQKINKIPMFKKPWVQSITAFVVIFGLLGIFLFWQVERNTVSIENSNLEAPIINLTPASPGTLNALYVKEGDRVEANAQIALVGSQIISTQNAGIVASAPRLLGAYFLPGQTVVSVVNDKEMKVVGQIEETKGLSSLEIGQRAAFSVDAFPGKRYEGTLSEISPVSNDNGIIFSISDQRPTKKFNVKIYFNVADYPELKSGMSAKLTVYTK
ncbi:MAG TPA: efflux RND transporter periplasmic adaptor subunit [Candidatus Paceibacterota bacterium]|jgi:multidrug resistance efflux pump|nr:efflux RND transporter periplasmic adaptor subunit [Candidatus Paceibacterota bacterium]